MITRTVAALLSSCLALVGCSFDGTGFGDQPEATQAGTSSGSTTGEPATTTTEDTTTAPPTTTTGDLCGNYQKDDGEECDVGPNGNGVCTPFCTYNVCGDNYVGSGEDCDGDIDGCVNCQLASCGNGVTDAGEQCDDGNADETDACLSTCKSATCGDGFVQAGVEQCDDGNELATDGCVPGCVSAACGDGHVWEGNEFCDDGNQVDSDECPNSCGPPGCGDGIESPGEECDDGNQVNEDGCTNACKDPTCGDGIVQAGEECDDGQTQNSDEAACTAACKNNICGDGKVLMGVEQCDDGNQVDDDGCTNGCKNPACGDGIQQAGEKCDDGNQVETDACLNNCELNVCGDGKLNMQGGAEQCDDGNTDPFDACREDCTPNVCGDGYLNPEDEDCDHGPLNDNDQNKGTCRDDCTRSAFLVFVSSKQYVPGGNDFNSIAAADARCGDLAAADAGALKIKGGHWKAWLSDGMDGPADNLHPSTLPYRTLHDGATATIAINWQNLSDGGIDTPLDITDTNTEIGANGNDCEVGNVVWTAVHSDGSFGDHCLGWTSNLMAENGRAGSVRQSGGQWTDACDVPCDSPARIYCIEQP